MEGGMTMQRAMLFFGLCVIVCNCGCFKSPTGEKTSITVGGRVWGLNGIPVVEAEIIFYSNNSAVKAGDTVRGNAWKTMTDPTGHYEFSQVGSGNYMVRATQRNSLCAFDSVSFRQPANINLAVTVDLWLDSAASVQGAFDSAFVASALDTNGGHA
jgi:hypothetical protein